MNQSKTIKLVLKNSSRSGLLSNFIKRSAFKRYKDLHSVSFEKRDIENSGLSIFRLLNNLNIMITIILIYYQIKTCWDCLPSIFIIFLP
ncbi:hypothetical protein BpHYR1_032441 [Brachionus plicatilis]|uniref:Uncharacterized protein n=1 Tax=Brachionus plicatilis TaxID=10195 RepID=A0A3M7PLS3_BRAPC|nr:hypothetical protein BpHYR1_032441 [Brachionus plicatilis]